MTITINKGICRADAVRIVNCLVDPKKNGGQFHGSNEENSKGSFAPANQGDKSRPYLVHYYHCDDLATLSDDLFGIISDEIAHGNPGELGKIEFNIL
jgi:hypothetical protein